MSSASSSAAKSRPERAPVLRALYAVVFFGIALSALTAGWPEFEHLLFALSRPYHFGDPPRLLTLSGGLLLAVTVVAVAIQFLRGREIPLYLSAVMLGSALMCLSGLGVEVPRGRNWAAADKQILDVASKVHRQMVEVLQTEAVVPKERQPWLEELQAAAKEAPPPARTRMFLDVPWDVERVEEEDALPELLRPGTLVVYVAPQGEAFQIHPIGFDTSGKVAPLKDDRGRPVILRGTFNPEMKQAPSRPMPQLPPVALPGVAQP